MELNGIDGFRTGKYSQTRKYNFFYQNVWSFEIVLTVLDSVWVGTTSTGAKWSQMESMESMEDGFRTDKYNVFY